MIAVVGGAIRVSTPYLYVSLGETLTEKSGRVNLGLEGTLVMGAMSGYAIAYLTGSPWLGVLVAGAIGAGFGLLHAVVCSLPRGNDIAVGIAISFTLGRLQTTACSSPNPAPIAPATSTPSHGEPVRYAIAYRSWLPSPACLRARGSHVRSSRSASRRGSRRGTASRHGWRLRRRRSSLPRRRAPRSRAAPATVERVGGEQRDEEKAFKDQRGRVRKTEAPLQEPAARGDPAQQNVDRDDRQRILTREERDEDPGVAVADDERGAEI